MWYVWKVRNDFRFNNKRWTVWQVHNQAKAEINMANTALQEDEPMADADQMLHQHRTDEQVLQPQQRQRRQRHAALIAPAMATEMHRTHSSVIRVQPDYAPRNQGNHFDDAGFRGEQEQPQGQESWQGATRMRPQPRTLSCRYQGKQD